MRYQEEGNSTTCNTLFLATRYAPLHCIAHDGVCADVESQHVDDKLSCDAVGQIIL